MAIHLVNSFLGRFRNHNRAIEMNPVPNELYSDYISDEMLEPILDLLGDPARTALVDKKFKRCSDHSYEVLIESYSTHPSLTALLPLEGAPVEKVKRLYFLVIGEAKSYGIETKTVEPDLVPLAPQRLARIRELTLQRSDDKFYFYRTVFFQINTQLAKTFDKMTREEVFALAEKSLGSLSQLFSSPPTKLNLGSHHLTYLPPQIRNLKALRELNLHHNNLTVLPPELSALTKLTMLALNKNPLSPGNVKAVCQTLPKLRCVVVDNEQPELIEMFQTHFPNLQLQIGQILRLQEEI